MIETDQTAPRRERELLQKYLEGTLSPAEEREVAGKYEVDAAFRDALDGLDDVSAEDLAASMNRLDDRVARRVAQGTATSADTDRGVGEGMVRVLPRQKRFRRMVIAASVAFLVLFAGTIFFLQSPSPGDKLVAAHFTPKPYPDVITRGGNEDLSQQEKVAISAYNAENYEVAVENFGELHDQFPEMAKYGLYLAISDMSVGHYEKAVELLRSMESNAGAYTADVEWYLGLALLKTGDRNGAVKYFRPLAEDNETFYQAGAQEILGRIAP